jgi:ATPase subunit of ABC transporter with duplicated ATPase domains
MRKHNGKQLYGIQKILTTLKMGMNKELKKLSIKQKLAMNYVSKKKAEWPLKKQAVLEIIDECPSYDEKRLPEFYKRMGFPVSKN